MIQTIQNNKFCSGPIIYKFFEILPLQEQYYHTGNVSLTTIDDTLLNTIKSQPYVKQTINLWIKKYKTILKQTPSFKALSIRSIWIKPILDGAKKMDNRSTIKLLLNKHLPKAHWCKFCPLMKNKLCNFSTHKPSISQSLQEINLTNVYLAEWNKHGCEKNIPDHYSTYLKIFPEDIEKFNDSNWFNDDMVNKWQNLLQLYRRLFTNKNTLFLNSFFYSDMKRNYENTSLTTWINSQIKKDGLGLNNLDMYKTIILPINLQNVHWLALRININQDVFEYYLADPFGCSKRNATNIIKVTFSTYVILDIQKINCIFYVCMGLYVHFFTAFSQEFV